MFSHDVRYAVRLLTSNPGFAIVALLTMALGIGANTAIFSVIDSVLLRQAPVTDIDSLAVVWETDRNTSTTREPASLPDYLDFKQRSQRVQQLASFDATEVNYTPDQGEASRLQALQVSDELLPMLGVRPVAGRGFTAEEARAGGPACDEAAGAGVLGAGVRRLAGAAAARGQARAGTAGARRTAPGRGGSGTGAR